MSDPRTDLPSASAPNFNQRLRETIQTYLGKQGNPLDRGLTLRDLIENGLVKIRDGFTLRPGQGTLPLGPGSNIEEAYDPDLTPPPTPAGFSVNAAISHVFVEHDAPIYRQGHGHLRTRLYGKIVNTGDPLPTFADAVEIAQFAGTVYAHPSNPATTWRLWIKWETVDGVLSVDPAGGTNGLEAITGQDVSRLVKAMTGPGNPFKVVPEQFTLPDGTVIPAGTYTADAFIHNGQITNAKIANLAVDDAKIASLSVAKLNAGTIRASEYIESTGYVAGSAGWRIDGNGNAELSNVTVRGTINSSTINGSTINSGALNIQSDGGTGYGVVRSAYKWWGDSEDGWVLARQGSDGATFADFNGGLSRIWMSSWGDCGISFPKFSVDNAGNAYFGGSLAVGTVTFEALASKVATDFSAPNIWVPNDTWTSYRFYMTNAGVVNLLAIGQFTISSYAGNHRVWVAIDADVSDPPTSYDGVEGFGESSGVVSTLRILDSGYYKIWVRVHHDYSAGNHLVRLNILRGYR